MSVEKVGNVTMNVKCEWGEYNININGVAISTGKILHSVEHCTGCRAPTHNAYAGVYSGN